MALSIGISRRVCSMLRKNVHSHNGIGSLRFSSRKDCAEVLEPKCAEENLEKVPPCPEKVERLKFGQPYIPPGPPNSMWSWPECCNMPCKDRPIRMDELYYKTSDKLKRHYQQTWCPCPPLRIKEIPVCCFEQYNFPVMERRKRKAEIISNKKPSGCSIQSKTSMPCGIPVKKLKQKCPRFTLKGCAPARRPPSCLKDMKRDCVPEKTPYPSYSECIKCEIDPARPVECKCLDRPMLCEVWAEYRRRLVAVKVPKLNDE